MAECATPEAEAEQCWLCLNSEAAGTLCAPCACPRKAHLACLSRWQLQSAGTRCETPLPCLPRAGCARWVSN